MKKLTLPDAFRLARVLKEADVKAEVSAVLKEIESGKNTEDASELGFALIYDCVINCASPKGEALVYEFLAGAFDMTADEVQKLSFKEMKGKIKELVKENDLNDFFDSALKSMR